MAMAMETKMALLLTVAVVELAVEAVEVELAVEAAVAEVAALPDSGC